MISAPRIDLPGLAWFNSAGPLALADLRGRLVILDFWTFCCINCMHVLPILKAIEETWPREVAVIGVHSPKFAAERDGANLAHAVARYGIRHPVIHDPGMAIWRAYTVRAWPTLVFIAPDGKIIGQLSGEPDRERLMNGIAEMLATWRQEGILRPGGLELESPGASGGRLSFPGKIKPVPGAPARPPRESGDLDATFNARGDSVFRPPTGGTARWAAADAGHHQIVLFDDAGSELARYGSGQSGFADGASEASFQSPQGLAAEPDTIYVADTGNHAIRRVALADGRVTTLAGNGARGRPLTWRSHPGPDIALASPWDLEIRDGRLFFANAGTHQLGELDLGGGGARALAGTGGEHITDGPAAAALLAQPSGLALDPAGATLYFADSETSAVRALSLGTDAEVTTLVGTGLFDFGHANGAFADAKFQHPLGLAWWKDGLVVADSYNGRLRFLDLEEQTVADVGESG
ncbi:MAG: thioredoxin-like domain-containing protein, partial [Pseudomonadota bacterium]